MHGYIGASESGKTYTMQCHASRVVKAGWSVVVVDLVSEWPNPDAWTHRPRYIETDDVRAACMSVERGRPLTVYRPPLGMRDAQYAELTNSIAHACIRGPHTVLCVPEASIALKEHHPLPGHVADIVRRFRHVHARLWWDTQQLADVHKGVLAQTQRLHYFGGAWERDGGRCKRRGGDALIRAIDEAMLRANADNRGWHVAIRRGEPRRESYALTRE